MAPKHNVAEQIEEIISILREVGDDPSVPRNVKLKIQQTIANLEEKTEASIKVNKALHFLDEIADDSNMEPYTRTQIWNVVSLLEKVC